MRKEHEACGCACGCQHDHHEHAHHHDEGACPHCEAKLQVGASWSRSALVRIIVSATLFVASVFLPVDGWTALLVYLIPYAVVGCDVVFGAFRNLLHGRVFDEQFLMALATLGAFAVGEYSEAVIVMLLYQLGELLQSIAVGRSRRFVAALMALRPDVAHVVREGDECAVSPEEVAVGEVVAVYAGERIPLDGVILEGATSLDTSALTGESVPVAVGVGDRVLSGSVNQSGKIYIKVESVYGESAVARVLELAEHNAKQKAHVERFITRFSRGYTPVVVGLAVLVALLPPIAFGAPFETWIYRALSFLVISCPCALVISVPLSFFCAIGAASRNGVLIKGSEYLEQLSRVEEIAFDKTGTLTKGELSVVAIHSEGIDGNELLGLAAALENGSTHPIARGILRAFGNRPRAASDVTEQSGRGVSGHVDGAWITLGNLALMREIGIDAPCVEADKTAVYVARNKEYLGCILLADALRTDAACTVAALKKSGVRHVVMLSGDRAEIAQQIGAAVGVDEVHAELLPGDKVKHLEEMMKKGNTVAFVGDGINDAPVLALADVGVAMGAVASDAAVESADIVLMEEGLSRLPFALRLARKTMRIVRQNIAFALFAKAVILLLAALGIANMWVAVFGDVGVMLLATGNALRLCNAKGRNTL